VVQDRPIDHLHILLMNPSRAAGDNLPAFRAQIFDCYGDVEATAMCLALVCNLPADAGSSLFGGDFSPQPSRDPRFVILKF
jgi:hypothetical protein